MRYPSIPPRLKWCSMVFLQMPFSGLLRQVTASQASSVLQRQVGEVGGQEQQALDAAEVNPEERCGVRKDVKKGSPTSCSQMMNASTCMLQSVN